MAAVRDFILVLSAAISALCLVYLVFNIEMLKAKVGNTSSLFAPAMKQLGLDETPEADIRRRLNRPAQ